MGYRSTVSARGGFKSSRPNRVDRGPKPGESVLVPPASQMVSDGLSGKGDSVIPEYHRPSGHPQDSRCIVSDSEVRGPWPVATILSGVRLVRRTKHIPLPSAIPAVCILKHTSGSHSRTFELGTPSEVAVADTCCKKGTIKAGRYPAIHLLNPENSRGT